MRAGLTFRLPKKAEPYAEALRRAGVEPVLISPEAPRPLTGLDGLVISGGSDIEPARYGEGVTFVLLHPHRQRLGAA